MARITVEDCLKGENAIITRFYRKFYRKIHTVFPGKEIILDDIKIQATKTFHGTECVGFIFEIDGKKVGYTSDTGYTKSLAKQFDDMDLLIINILRPENHYLKNHLTTEEVINILKEMANSERLAEKRSNVSAVNFMASLQHGAVVPSPGRPARHPGVKYRVSAVRKKRAVWG